MRNPIRLKNLRLRFVPLYVLGVLSLVWMEPTVWGFIFGALLVLLGACLRSWGAGHLVKNDRLTTTGPYAHVQHPLYVGTLLVGMGFSIIVGGWVALGLLALLLPWFFGHYFPRKERVEGARLEELYGADYKAYRDHVPALIPRLTPWVPGESAGEASRWSGQRYSGNNELGTVIALAAGIGVFAIRVFAPL